MDWLNFLTRDIAPLAIIGLLLAAGLTCWKTGSLHPINTRLLRIFISREEIEDPTIKKSISDQSALVSFRMTHGVQAQTLTDAIRLTNFANSKNVPLSLIGRAGWAFNLKKLKIESNRVPHKAWLALPSIFFSVFAIGGIVAGAAATSDSLLVTIKKTNTLVWLSREEARAASWLQKKPGEINKSDCSAEAEDSSTPNGFKAADRSILCSIWEDSSLESHFSKEIPKQRKVFLVLLVVLAWYAFIFLGLLRTWKAQISLKNILS